MKDQFSPWWPIVLAAIISLLIVITDRNITIKHQDARIKALETQLATKQ